MKFDDTYILPKAGDYSSPLNSNDSLPLVYGDLTDGTNGNWKLPCIDTANYVYCFSADEVLSVGNGNSINIYSENIIISGASYAFSESNNYKGLGSIATVTFTTDRKNENITARGKGKDDSGTLIENIIDQIYDFLTVQNSFTSSNFDTTIKVQTKEIFSNQNYKAAGVIISDKKIWDIIQEMLSSFLGVVYINANNKLVFEIEDGSTVINYSAIIPKTEMVLNNAKQRLISLINQCPSKYAYNYSINSFSKYNDGSSHINIASQNIYGVQQGTGYDFFWCRDLTSIQTMQEIITTKYGIPIWDIEFTDVTMKRIDIDAGDAVTASFDHLYYIDGTKLINQFIKILSVSPNFEKGEVKFRGIDLGTYLSIAYLANGTYIASGIVMAGGEKDLTDY